MKWLSVGMFCGVFLLATNSMGAEGRGLRGLWPFGREGGDAAPSRPRELMSDSQPSRLAPSAMPSLPSPTQLLSKMEQGTQAFFAKTRSTMRGLQEFGSNLVPPMLKPRPTTAKKRENPIAAFFKGKPTRPAKEVPQTAADWLSLPRPDF